MAALGFGSEVLVTSLASSAGGSAKGSGAAIGQTYLIILHIIQYTLGDCFAKQRGDGIADLLHL